MDSLTMERDKRELGPAHEQGAGLEHTHTKHNGIQSEIDLAERDEHTEEVIEDEHKHVDYSNFTKAQFVELVKELSKETNAQKIEATVREIKPLYDDIREKERNAALQKFIQEGGVAEDFEYKGDENDSVFDANMKLIRDRRNQ